MTHELSFAWLVGELRERGVRFEDGLSDKELAAAEEKFAIHFPADLREFLQLALPVSNNFPNWRTGTIQKPTMDRVGGKLEMRGHTEITVEDALRQPIEGICFDVEQSGFWLERWGTRPAESREAVFQARKELEKVPKLIPVYSHRYIPVEPSSLGNPVFSVHQSDVIYYGNDLIGYFVREFNLGRGGDTNGLAEAKTPRRIPFWSDLVEL